MPDPPRRILEKSRTVRRRYQRSNKRFQFTASQIERIERDEERERRAQKLREKEKKRIANKKKKAEKEAREREERKQLGLPDPNTSKVPGSQPLLLDFFGKKKEAQQLEKHSHTIVAAELDERRSCPSTAEDTEVETDLGEDWLSGYLDEEIDEQDWQDGKDHPDLNTFHDPISAVPTPGSGNQESVPEIMIDKNGEQKWESRVSQQMSTQAASAPDDCEGKVNGNTDKPPAHSVNAPDSASDLLRSLGESFEDETSLLLLDMDPDTLHTADNSLVYVYSDAHSASKPIEVPFVSSVIKQPRVSPNSCTSPECVSVTKKCGESLKTMEANTPFKKIAPEKIEGAKTKCENPKSAFEIYQDPEEVLALISTQDLMDVGDQEDDNFKENWDPNIPRDERLLHTPPVHLTTPSRRAGLYAKIQSTSERRPLSMLSQVSDRPSPDGSKRKSGKSQYAVRCVSSPTPRSCKAILASANDMASSNSSLTKRDEGANGNDDDDGDEEFGEFDISIEELEKLCS